MRVLILRFPLTNFSLCGVLLDILLGHVSQQGICADVPPKLDQEIVKVLHDCKLEVSHLDNDCPESHFHDKFSGYVFSWKLLKQLIPAVHVFLQCWDVVAVDSQFFELLELEPVDVQRVDLVVLIEQPQYLSTA